MRLGFRADADGEDIPVQMGSVSSIADAPPGLPDRAMDVGYLAVRIAWAVLAWYAAYRLLSRGGIVDNFRHGG